MKKITFIFVLISLLIFYTLPSSAVIDTGLKVYDNAGLFTEDEANKLAERARELVEKSGMDVLIVTIEDAEGKSSRNYADDFYDDNGFGLGNDKSGLVLLIDMDNREAYISTCGSAIRLFTDDRLARMIDKITGPLSDGDYAKGASVFLDDVEYYYGKGIPSDQYNYDTETKQRDYYRNSPDAPKGVARSLKNLPLYIAIALGGSLIIVGIMALNNRGTKTTHAGTYLEPGSFNLRDKRDIYIRTTVTQHQINTNSGGGSRSSVHSGRSGSSHGGRGGRF